MKLVIQKVKKAKLKVDEKLISQIGKGLVIYVGVDEADDRVSADYLAAKTANMRIFENDLGKMDFSCLTLGLEALVVSQFTLCADCSHGNRPDFTNAAKPAAANELYLYFNEKLNELGLKTATGVFGADMQIEQLNDGPVTIVISK